MIRRCAEEAFEALVLDLDGTLLPDGGKVRPRVVAALHAVRAKGVRVMIATGRSEPGTAPLLEELGLDCPAVVYNGAALYCPDQRRLIEEQLLSNRTVRRTLEYAEREDLTVIAMPGGSKYATPPRNSEEERALQYLELLNVVSRGELPTEHLIRITLFANGGRASKEFCREVEATIAQPVYLTHFPLNVLADQRQSSIQVVDIQPPCRGKGEALRVLQERYGIPAERVVAVGDASNDVPMLEPAGLGVAMKGGMAEAVEAADRVIGGCNSDAIAELIEELWGV